MTHTSFAMNADHPAGVLRALVARQAAGERCALIVVTGTEGGAVRADGALMLVPLQSAPAGYISNGCVDADVAVHARRALQANAPARLRYGKGSPFIDIRLPCSGAIDLAVLPDPEPSVMAAAEGALKQRREIALAFDVATGGVEIGDAGSARAGWSGGVFAAVYRPRLAIRIAGRGPEALALARLAVASGMEVAVQSPDEDVLAAARALGVEEAVPLTAPSAPPPVHDDPWTAFVMMFHDRDWEEGLLRQALEGDAFYIGALGSRRTQASRLEMLAAAGVGEAALGRIRGPIGLVPSQRDASTLAISTLAEIIAAGQAAFSQAQG